MNLKSINPANLELIGETTELTNSQIKVKIGQADAAFAGWRQTSFSERSILMKRVATLLRQNKPRLAKLLTSEVGKTIFASEAELEKSAMVCDFYAEKAQLFLAPKEVITDASESYVRYDPLGVVLAVMPWNFPFWQVFRFAAPAIMAGNVGLLKHASNVQLCGAAIENIFVEAGFPVGVFQNLAIGSAKVAPLIRDRAIKAVTLTGSEYAGSQVAKVAGEEIKKTVLELGGSDPFIVFADADLDAAAAAAALGRMQHNAGQSCIAAKRFIVEEKIAQEFTLKLKQNIEKLVVGDPLDPNTDVGPLTNEQMVVDIERQVAESVAMGAKVITGGARGSAVGYYYLPTILTNVTRQMPVFCQEVFGPALPIISFKNEAEAMDMANDCEYGLGATIFTSNISNAKQLAVKVEAGCVFINNQVKSDHRLPFGGIKKSGYGRELSSAGIKEFVNIKTVYIK